MEPDRPLYSQKTWSKLPKILADLLERGRIRVCVFEDTESGQMTCFGVTSFVRPGFLDAALEKGDGLAEAALAAESSREPAFLNYKQVAEANRRDDLRAFTFFGVIAGTDLNDPATRENLVPIMDGWTFFHRGFSLSELWFEPVTPILTESMAKTAMELLRERDVAEGVTARVFRLTRSEAEGLMPNWPAWLMFAPRPRFGFSRAEQQLLELALLDYSDRDAAAGLDLSAEAVKKRWRSIYGKVSGLEPGLLGPELTGADQRRALLQMLRNNLQEIRPY
jgi:hypothetical protein